MRITVFLHSLTGGGTERAASMLANAWSGRGNTVSLITLDSRGHAAYELRPEITRVGLGLMGPSRGLVSAVMRGGRRVWALRRAIAASHPDVLVSLGDVNNVLALLASQGKRWPTVISERTDPRQHRLGTAWARLRRWTYGRASACVVQTEAVADEVRGFCPRLPIAVIPNAVRPLFENDSRPVEESLAEPTIFAMGRLSREKGFDLLIDAFHMLCRDFPDWRVEILGEGPERRALEQQLSRLELTGRVRLPGWVSDPERRLKRGQIFVLPSRYEGFPNALLEALALGLPAVAFDCPSGPREILRDGLDGFLVPPEDVGAMAQTLKQLMENSASRLAMSAAAGQARERFSLASHLRSWDEVFGDVGVSVDVRDGGPPDVATPADVTRERRS